MIDASPIIKQVSKEKEENKNNQDQIKQKANKKVTIPKGSL